MLLTTRVHHSEAALLRHMPLSHSQLPTGFSELLGIPHTKYPPPCFYSTPGSPGISGDLLEVESRTDTSHCGVPNVCAADRSVKKSS